MLLLFVIVGSSWSVEGLAVGGGLALAAMLARFVAKGVAVLSLGWFSGQSWRQGIGLTLSLTPLSATALVMYAHLQAWLAGFAA